MRCIRAFWSHDNWLNQVPVVLLKNKSMSALWVVTFCSLHFEHGEAFSHRYHLYRRNKSGDIQIMSMLIPMFLCLLYSSSNKCIIAINGWRVVITILNEYVQVAHQYSELTGVHSGLCQGQDIVRLWWPWCGNQPGSLGFKYLHKQITAVSPLTWYC